MDRIYLSPPDVGAIERDLLLDAFDSGWIAPLGPHVDAFEDELAAFVGARHAVALSSGTAALHLALLVAADVGAGDEVLVPALTFVATANAVRYLGATPVFVDSEWSSWNIDPSLVASELDARATEGRLQPKAVVAVDLYGQCADYEPLRAACDRHGVAMIEDAAEAIGASYRGAQAGTLGDVGVFSFNGNKALTTSGGGMLVTDDAAVAERVRHLAAQAREPVLHFEHADVGFNYRMSNLLAALGRGQLSRLPAMISRRRSVYERYVSALGSLPGVSFMPETPWGRSSRWLTVALIDPASAGLTRDDLIAALDAADIEARPAWKPMHLQPLFAGSRVVGDGRVSDTIFECGLCLPSGSSMTDADIDRVLAVLVDSLSSRP